MDTEIWKPIIVVKNGISYDIHYEVSNMGNIRDTETNEIKTFYKQGKSKKNEYYHVSIRDPRLKSNRCLRVHKTVADAFIPNTDNKPRILHLDGNILNNRVDNLAWATVYEFIHYNKDVLGRPSIYGLGDNSRNHKYDEKLVRSICDLIETNNYTIPEMASIIGVSPSYITSIKHVNWGHVTSDYEFKKYQLNN